jgi:cbb3-type cytochrome c oxidase subunit III
LKNVNKFRIALVAAAVATGAALVEFIQGPIEAAPQSDAAQVETAPKADTQTAGNAGAESYAKHCAICHGEQREGNLPGFPPLLGINRPMPDNKIAELIRTGKGRMPGFPSLQGSELTAMLHFLTNADGPEQASAGGAKAGEASGLAETGGALFHQNCAFCHGRDAMGGETGPDLTQSNLVLTDTTGEKIAAVVREGRPDNKMPGFNFSSQEMRSLIAFIRMREAEAKAHPGGRRGVSIEDLQTGNAEAGKRYFEGPGGCTRCHSPAGDLAGLANRHKGLQLEQRMLYPEDARSTVTVTLPSGENISGTLAYRDEFTVALRDSNGIYRSWPASHVQYVVTSPADAHVELFDKYTDDDIHNLMAYLQTLR